MAPQVKKIEIHTHPVGEEIYLKEISEFDERGNLILQEEYLPDGSIENKTESWYDGDNRILEEKQYTDEGVLADHKKYNRNEQGELLKVEIAYQDGSKAFQTSHIDPDSLLETIEEKDEDDELEFRELNQYNSDKQLLSKEVYDFNNKLKEAFTYEYNSDGNLVKRAQFDHKRKPELQTEYKYNENGLMVYRANRNRKGKLSDFLKVEYDSKGQVVKQSFSDNFFFVFEYDTNGNAVLEERLSANNEMEYQSRFEYDENKQLIKEINAGFTRELTYHYHKA